MTRFKGNKIVKVYSQKAPFIAGGSMIASGGYLGVHRSPEYLFFFNEEARIAGGKKVVRKNRVTNISKGGLYKKSDLIGV